MTRLEKQFREQLRTGFLEKERGRKDDSYKARAGHAGIPDQTRLDSPPADPRVAHQPEVSEKP